MANVMWLDVFMIDATPRYLRITYRDASGKSARFVGMVRSSGDRITGSARPVESTLEMFIADPADVLKIERQNPKYEEWETV